MRRERSSTCGRASYDRAAARLLEHLHQTPGPLNRPWLPHRSAALAPDASDFEAARKAAFEGAGIRESA
jgi:hypothetical protein